MKTSNNICINRKPVVLHRIGISKSTFHERLNKGLIPPSISLGDRAVGWLEHEITLLISAMAAGHSEAELQNLVKGMLEKRQQQLEKLM